MSHSPLLNQLLAALRCLPGVGPKSAQRMAFQLLAHNRRGGKELASLLQQAMDQINHCEQCRTFSETTRCSLCRNEQRHQHLLCVVESPADLMAIEQTGFRGRYFVLHGHLSPIDGIGAEEIGLPLLQQQLQQATINEIIIATNATVEGEATAHYIAQTARRLGIACSRLAQGIPMGSELEYIDGGTLARAFASRETLA